MSMGLTTTAVPRPIDRLIVLILLFDEDFCYDFDTTARSEYGQKKERGESVDYTRLAWWRALDGDGVVATTTMGRP